MNASNVPGVMATQANGGRPLVVVQQQPPRRWRTRFLFFLLVVSVIFNFVLFSAYHAYLGTSSGMSERYESGDLDSNDKIALIQVEGTIMPPFTGRVLKAIEQAGKDDEVKGILLVVDSPGGLVADSQEIYHGAPQPGRDHHKMIYVSMKRLAASGGYYVAMGAGPSGVIFAEPTTWTGSIGVILPHYDISGLAEKVGVKEDSLKTGPLKDTLSMFRPVSEADKKVWNVILDESFNRFKTVIADSRKMLDIKSINELATGQVYTAEQAKAKKLIDEIGYQQDAIQALKTKLNLPHARIVKYESPPGVLEMLISSRDSSHIESNWKALLESAVPRAYYLFTTIPGLALP